jgi:hypothetical protein
MTDGKRRLCELLTLLEPAIQQRAHGLDERETPLVNGPPKLLR